MDVSKELTVKVSDELDQVVKAEFAKHGMIATNKKSKYGHEFRYSVQGHAKDESEISKQISRAIMDAINANARRIFAQNNLEVKKINGKYGQHFTYTISADPVELNENGINIASQVATDFIYGAWQYGFTPTDAKQLLGTGREFNNGKYILIGMQVGRKSNKLVCKKGSDEYLIDERAITKWGGKLLNQTSTVVRVES